MSNISKSFSLKDRDQHKHLIICRECSRDTSHLIVASFDESGSEELGGGHSIDWNLKNQIIQCLGCETVSFRTVQTCSEEQDYDYEGNSYYPETIKYYPGRAKGIKALEDNLLPYKIRGIYKETILSIENGQYVLAGIGIRAIIETICKEVKAEGKDLFHKINWLKVKSVVTEHGAETLHKLRVLGNDAAHEVKAHNSAQLELAMKIIEHMLDGTYIIPAKLKSAFPPQS